MTSFGVFQKGDLAEVPFADVKRDVPVKRIFIYGINYAPEPTGVGRYTGELGAYLAQQGLEVDVVTAAPHYPGWVVRGGYRNWFSTQSFVGGRVTRCPLFLKSEMGGIWRLVAPLSFALSSAPIAIWRIITNRPDTVLCVEPTLFSAPAALLAAKLVGAKTVLHVQDLEVDAAFAVGHLQRGFLQKIAEKFERFILRRFDVIVTISYRMKERLEAKGVPSRRLSLVRNWVDLEKIKPLDRPSIYRKELSISNDSFVALYAGNMGPKQALPLLLEAAKKLVSRPNLLFIIVGEGPEKRDMVARYGRCPNILFLPLQPENRLCELLNLADVHILPQHVDTADMVLPSKLGGMLASGRPCIVMANPHTEMYQTLGDSVVLTPAGDVDALVRAILRVIDGKNRPSVEGQLRLAEQFSAESNLFALYNVIVGSNSSALAASSEVQVQP